MDEIKPVARVTGEGEIGSPIGVGRMWDWPADGSHLYDQQAIDSLRAEVEFHKLDAGALRSQMDVLRDGLVSERARAGRAEAEADALRKDAERYRLLCELIDAGDQGADDAVGDAYALGAGALDLFLDEQPRAPAIYAAKQAAD